MGIWVKRRRLPGKLFIAGCVLLVSGCQAKPDEVQGGTGPGVVRSVAPPQSAAQAPCADPAEAGVPYKNEFGLSYTISAGDKKPGEEAAIHLQEAEPDKAGRLLSTEADIHYKLTELGMWGQEGGTVEEQIVKVADLSAIPSFNVRLPEKGGACYWLTAEMKIGGTTEDMLSSIIHVPVQALAAELRMEQTDYPAAGGTMKLTLHNTGPSALSFGVEYGFERLEEEQWEPVSLGERVIPMIGYNVSSGGSWEQELQYPRLPPGTYRVWKEVDGSGTDLQQRVYADFRLVE